jgi:hypothetical protein
MEPAGQISCALAQKNEYKYFDYELLTYSIILFLSPKVPFAIFEKEHKRIACSTTTRFRKYHTLRILFMFFKNTLNLTCYLLLQTGHERRPCTVCSTSIPPLLILMAAGSNAKSNSIQKAHTRERMCVSL